MHLFSITTTSRTVWWLFIRDNLGHVAPELSETLTQYTTCPQILHKHFIVKPSLSSRTVSSEILSVRMSSPYSHSIVTVALSCVISEIKRDICWKSRFVHTRLLGVSPSGYCHNVWCGEWCGYPTVKTIWWYVYEILTQYWCVTDRQDGEKSCHSIVCAMHSFAR